MNGEEKKKSAPPSQPRTKPVNESKGKSFSVPVPHRTPTKQNSKPKAPTTTSKPKAPVTTVTTSKPKPKTPATTVKSKPKAPATTVKPKPKAPATTVKSKPKTPTKTVKVAKSKVEADKLTQDRFARRAEARVQNEARKRAISLKRTQVRDAAHKKHALRKADLIEKREKLRQTRITGTADRVSQRASRRELKQSQRKVAVEKGVLAAKAKINRRRDDKLKRLADIHAKVREKAPQEKKKAGTTKPSSQRVTRAKVQSSTKSQKVNRTSPEGFL